MKPLANRTEDLIQSNIRAVTLMLDEVGGINLGQGICDMPTPEPLKLRPSVRSMMTGRFIRITVALIR